MDAWRKSTYSSANGGDCVEVASTVWSRRDTADRNGATLSVPLPRVARIHARPQAQLAEPTNNQRWR